MVCLCTGHLCLSPQLEGRPREGGSFFLQCITEEYTDKTDLPVHRWVGDQTDLQMQIDRQIRMYEMARIQRRSVSCYDITYKQILLHPTQMSCRGLGSPGETLPGMVEPRLGGKAAGSLVEGCAMVERVFRAEGTECSQHPTLQEERAMFGEIKKSVELSHRSWWT